MPVVLTGPAPLTSPRGGVQAALGFCAVCAASWKAVAFETQAGAVEQADRAPAQAQIALKAPGAPQLAVAYGLATLPAPPGSPQAGSPVIVPLPLCWTHLTAIRFLGSGIIPAPAGIPLLDGSHRPS